MSANHYCTSCKELCEVEWSYEDCGIGSYEYMGAPGTDIRICGTPASDCCEAGVVHDFNEECNCTPPEPDYDYDDYEPLCE